MRVKVVLFGLVFLIWVSPLFAIRLFKIGESREVEMGGQIAGQLEGQYGVVKDEKLQELLDKGGNKLVKVCGRSHLKYTFKILKSDELNALACPGGFIYITKGLATKLVAKFESPGEDEQAVAAVLAHEIAHVARRHSIKEIEKALSEAFALELLFGLMDAKEGVYRAADIGLELISRGRSRHDENEADAYAVEYMFKAGYNPKALIGVFEVLKAAGSGVKMPKWLATHPPIDERVNNVQNRIRALESSKIAE